MIIFGLFILVLVSLAIVKEVGLSVVLFFFKLLLKQFWCWIKQPVMETERRGWWFKVVPSQSKGTWLSSTQQGSRFNATPCWIIMVSVSRADSPSRCYWASRKACMYLNVFSQEALWPSAPAAVLLSSADHCLQTLLASGSYIWLLRLIGHLVNLK